MTDGQLLFLIMALIYVGECLVWLPKGAYACVRFLGAKRRLRPAPSNFSSAKGGWIVAPPLPPLGTTFVTRSSPVCTTETGVSAFMIESPNPGFRPSSVIGPSIEWSEVERITRDGKKIFINGTLFVADSSPETAEDLLNFLIELWKSEAGDRNGRIATRVKKSFHTRNAERKIRFWERKSLSLRFYCNLLLLLLFVGLPACIIFFGASLETLICGVAALLTMFVVAFRFLFLYRRLFPTIGFDRWQWFFLILLVPQQSMRAHDLLLKGVVAGFHPLAVGDFALREDSVQRVEFMGRCYRDLLFPFPWDSLPDEKTIIIVEEYYQKFLRPEVDQFAREHAEELSSWCVPQPEEEAKCYCPRCFEMFSSKDTAQCQDCGGIETQQWVKAE